jgi:hypothetical protein
MPLRPQDWNVVVVGHWNRAILSPSGIANRLFGLPEGTPVKVLVPLDVVAPYHIQHENITVIPGSDRLIVAPVHDAYENLVEALRITRKALEELPRTPVFAAGLNLTYKSEKEVETLKQATSSTWDDALSDKRFEIISRSISRSLKWRNGAINVTISQTPGTTSEVAFNFDFKSQSTEAILEWLDLRVEDIKSQIDLILLDTIGLSPEDIGNV